MTVVHWLVLAVVVLAFICGVVVAASRIAGARARAWAESVEAREARAAEVSDVHDAAAKKIGTMTPEEVEAHAHELLVRERDRSRGGPLGPAPGAR